MPSLIMKPFEGPALKVARAIRHIEELACLLDDYGHRISIWYESVPEDPTYMCLKISEPPPSEIPMIIGDAVHNLRSSLDIMVCDIARMRNKSTNDVKFPFACDEAGLIKAVERHCRQLGEDVQKLLIDQRAFKGGNVPLRGIHDLDVLDKHNMIIPTIPVTWGRGFMEIALSELGSPRYISDSLTIIGHVAIMGDFATLGPLDEVIEANLAQKMYPEEYMPNRMATALFSNSSPFPSAHVLPTLETLVKVTIETISAFEQHIHPQ
ncbi:hypothetical protein [Xanthobacter autotrophicus]|uniref:hypothetical protein n=1 Tax=Xanthobacter autotrophicus TaxID=280 RepID=UPI0024A7449E|nr:hypothetical protein [Xanthobacter autotrophicus]MDI4655388.1 hypothetical protein [Xanthobacter autotrophicus]